MPRPAWLALLLLAACNRSPAPRAADGEAAMAAKAVADVDAATAEASQAAVSGTSQGTKATP